MTIYHGLIAYSAMIFIAGTGLGMAIEHWRASPLRRIRRKYRAERQSALRN